MIDASRCPGCARVATPPEPRCPSCGEEPSRTQLEASGRVLARTRFPDEDEAVVLVELEHGARLLARGPGGLGPGDAVRLERGEGSSTWRANPTRGA